MNEMLLISLAFKKSLQNLALFTISLAEEKLNTRRLTQNFGGTTKSAKSIMVFLKKAY